jgi:predicted nucleic acid-binding protein
VRRRHLLDTNVISELWRKRPDPAVVAFVGGLDDYGVSVIVLNELTYGVERAEASLRERLGAFMSAWRPQIEPLAIHVDARIAETAGRLRANAQKRGRILHSEDALIAATAMIHDATLVTRNSRDFEGLGVRLANPFSQDS